MYDVINATSTTIAALPMEGPAHTIHGLSRSQIAYVIGENQQWSVNARGQVLDRHGNLLAADVDVLGQALVDLGWIAPAASLPREAGKTPRFTAIRWDLFNSNDPAGTADQVRRAACR